MRKIIVFMIFLLFIMGGGFSFSQDVGEIKEMPSQNVEKTVSESEPQAETPKEEPQPTKPSKPSQARITLTLKNTDIKVFLQAIAEKANINIIPGPEVEGNVSARLKNIPWNQALDTILKAYGYGYEEVYPGVFLVTTIDKLAEKRQKEEVLKQVEELRMKRIPLTFLDAGEAKAVVDKFLSSRGKTVVDAYSNSLVVIDIRDVVKKIEDYLGEVDKKVKQVLLDVKVIEVSLNDVNKLGIKWQVSLTATGAKSSQFSFPFKDSFNKFNFYSDYIHSTIGSGDLVFGTLSAQGTSMALDVIFNKTKAKIVSQPKILVLNHKKGFIEIKTEEPIETATYDSGTGDYVYSVETKEYGVTLEVTPHINKDNYITLDIKPVVSDKLDDKQLTHSGEVPVISTSTTETSIILKDAETLVIGGVIKEKKDTEEQKVPLLGDIPLIGKLFSYKSDEVRRDELLIFITPHILK